MHSTNLWHKFNLYWRKISFVLLIFLLNNQLFSQTKVYNRRFLENYDDKEIHFGFYFGTGFSRFDFRHSDTFSSSADPTINISSPSKFTFKVGLVVNKYLNKRWDLRTTPGINISSKQLNYDQFNAATIVDDRDLDIFELPVLFKFKSDRRKNSRMYMLGGVNMLIETNIRKGQKALISKLPSKTTDLCLEYGFGFEQYLEFGKFTGELRFSHGIRNLFLPETSSLTQYRNGLDQLKSHTVTLYLFFE